MLFRISCDAAGAVTGGCQAQVAGLLGVATTALGQLGGIQDLSCCRFDKNRQQLKQRVL